MLPWNKKIMEEKEIEMTQEPTNDTRLAALEEQLESLKPKSPAADTCSRCGLYCLLGNNFLHDAAGRFVCGYCVNSQHSTTAFGGINDLESSKDWALSRLLGLPNKMVGISKRISFKFAYEIFDSIPRSNKRFTFVDRDALRKTFDHEYQPSHSIGNIVEVTEYMPIVDGKGRVKAWNENRHDPVFVPAEPAEIRRSPSRPLSPSEREDAELDKLERSMKTKLTRQERRKANLESQIASLNKALEKLP